MSTHFDGDVDENPDWDDHGKHPTITETTGYYEDAPVGGTPVRREFSRRYDIYTISPASSVGGGLECLVQRS